jgi:hypothetical protein
MPEKIKNLISAVCLKLVLDLICISYLSKAYAPFAVKLDLNAPKILQSYLLLLLMVTIIPKSKEKISSLIIWLLIALQYIPALTVYGLGNESSIWIFYLTGFWLSVYGVLYLNKKSPNSNEIARRKASSFNYHELATRIDQGLWIWIICILGYTYLAIVTLPSIKFATDFVNIYDARSNFKPILPFAAYILTWAINVINPFLIVYFGFIRKDKNFTIFSIASQLFLFIGNGQKTTLFSIPLLLIIIFFWNKGKINFSGICLSIMSLLIASWASFFYLGDIWSSALFASRVLIVPAMTEFYYYRFFVEYPPVLLSHGILGAFIPYQFDKLPWFLIGQHYMSNPSLSLNSGMLSDSYMNFKEFGLILNSFVFAVLLDYIDKVGFKKNQSLILSCVLMPFIWCLNGSLYSAFTTGGMGIGLLMISKIPNATFQRFTTVSIESTRKQ